MIQFNYNNHTITTNQLNILNLLKNYKSQNKVAELLNIPVSSINIQIKRLETKLSLKLLYSSPSGSTLSKEAENLLLYYNSLNKRIYEEPFVACGFVSGEIGKVLFEDVLISSFENILRLYNSGLTKIVGLDDPYWSYRIEGELFPVAKDYYVMVHSSKNDEDFDYKNMVGIHHSAHRIVWKTLKQEKIDFKISKVVKNPFYAIDLLDEGYSLLLNHSLIRYLKKEHIVEVPDYYEKTYYSINFMDTLKKANNMDNLEFEKEFEDLIYKKEKEIKNAGFELIL
nr:LysR family transcriptional regulator [Methanococcus voltae]